MAKNDLPSSTVAYITLITRVFWPFLGEVIIFIIFMIKWGDVFYDESSTFIENDVHPVYHKNDKNVIPHMTPKNG